MNPMSKKLIEDIPHLHDESQDELLEMAQMLYQNELLSAFNLTELDENVMNNKVHELFVSLFENNDKLNNNTCKEKMQDILKKLALQVVSDDLETGFIMLFSYSYFHLIHLFLCELFNEKKISDDCIHALENNI
jgi:hypothetical protein